MQLPPKNDNRLIVDPRPPKNVKKIMIPKPMPKAKKKPVKGPGGAYPMPTIIPSNPRNGGGIIGVEGRNVNSVYNTY